MSFKSKQNSFAKNINDENKANEIKESQQNKNIRNSSILPKTNSDTTNSATAQKWRNTVRGVVKINKVVNKNANYAAPELENLNTLEKIIKLQEDLKIVASIKQQFEGNQKKLIEKMKKYEEDFMRNKIVIDENHLYIPKEEDNNDNLINNNQNNLENNLFEINTNSNLIASEDNNIKKTSNNKPEKKFE